jgi:hypothetical protein
VSSSLRKSDRLHGVDSDDRHRHAQSRRPLLSLQEVTSTVFTYGIFIGSAVTTQRKITWTRPRSPRK